ncbi:HlyD family efflux transporter periplasmic adaptor subunit [[Clostridium] fimetarium]|uniref:RND related barrel-sandwich hybrid domain-containing protein n=1 Tax=[Clostridium] fimetarium TaxID=99656 RepID=A0A1I0QJX2_9FIRM|nr:HlyD family efflux transporter periplasmic adaptor subunit [[Clostridium] fimetarium]SEW26988.1 hypothetical protein SAMN05421659_10860 [[Clostridium] fimetarium]
MANRRRDIVKFRKKPRAAVIIFTIILIYLIAFISMYISKSKVRTYEVYAGSLTSNSVYKGIALRTEKVFNSSFSGNINYYIREGVKAKVGDTIYTVDETGRVAEILSQLNNDKNSLSADNLKVIKSTLNSFKVDYSGDEFNKVYDLKADINSTVLQSINENIVNNLDSIISKTGSENLFQTIKSDTSGVVEYAIDGYEEFNEDKLSSSVFDKNNNPKNNLKTESLIVANNPVYKVITSEDWFVYIPLVQSDIDKYELTGKSVVKIRFVKDDITTNADFSIVEKNGGMYGKLSLSKYMIRYANERFLDIELIASNSTGLKIPVTSLVDKDFYTIPKEYLTTGGNSNSYGFLCEHLNSDGNLVTEFKEVNIYSTTDTLCYVNTADFSPGDNIVKIDSTMRHIIGTTAALKGVYCVNTGYTTFRKVEIIEQNKEYCIVKKGTLYGITVYDHIILDGYNMKENVIIY